MVHADAPIRPRSDRVWLRAPTRRSIPFFEAVALRLFRRGMNVALSIPISEADDEAIRLRETWGARLEPRAAPGQTSDPTATVVEWSASTSAVVQPPSAVDSPTSATGDPAAMDRSSGTSSDRFAAAHTTLCLSPSPLSPFVQGILVGTAQERNGDADASSQAITPALVTPLWPVERRRLDALRETYGGGVRPLTHPRRYAVLELASAPEQGGPPASLPFVSDFDAIATVVGALPSDVDLLIAVHASPVDELPIAGADADELNTITNAAAASQRVDLQTLLRPGDRIIEEHDLRGALAGAACIIAGSESIALQSLLWDRPLIVSAESCTAAAARAIRDGDELATLLPDLLRSRAAPTPAQTSAVERFLFETLCRRLIPLTGDPLITEIGAAEIDAVAEAIDAELRPFARAADPTPAIAAFLQAERGWRELLRGELATRQRERLLLVTGSDTLGWFEGIAEPHQVITPHSLEEVPASELLGCDCLIFVPAAPPAAVDAIAQRLRGRGAAAVVDLCARLAQRRLPEPAGLRGIPPSTVAPDRATGAAVLAVSKQPAIEPPIDEPLRRLIGDAVSFESPGRLLLIGGADVPLLRAAHRAAPPARLTLASTHEAALRACMRPLSGDFPPRCVPFDPEEGLPLEEGEFDAVIDLMGSAAADGSQAAIADELARLSPATIAHAFNGPVDAPVAAALHARHWAAHGPIRFERRVATATPAAPRLDIYRPREPQLTLLRLHAVDATPFDAVADARERFIDPRDVIRLVDALRAGGWNFVTLSRATEMLRGGAPLPARCAVLTFDDGDRSVFTRAAPLLAERGIAAAVFPVVGAINRTFCGPRRGGVERPMLTAAQLRELAAAGWDVGSHSVTHTDLTHLSARQVQLELQDSRDELEDLLGAAVHYFALPDHDEPDGPAGQHIEQALAAGYRLVLTSQPGFVDRFVRTLAWPRHTLTAACEPAVVNRRLAAAHFDHPLDPVAAARQPIAAVDAPNAASAPIESGATPAETELAVRARRIVDECLRHRWQRVAVCADSREARQLLEGRGLSPLHIEAVISSDPTLHGRRIAGLDVVATNQWTRLGVDAVVVPTNGLPAELRDLPSDSTPRPAIVHVGSEFAQ